MPYLTGKTAICALMFHISFVLYLITKQGFSTCMKQKNANGNRLCVVSISMVLHIVLLAYPLSIIQEDKNRE